MIRRKKDIPVSGLHSVDKIDYTDGSNPITTNEGKIYNNHIAKLEKIEGGNSDTQRYRLTLKDGESIPSGGKIVFAGAGVGSPISSDLTIGTENVGSIRSTDAYRTSNKLKDRLHATTKIDDYISIVEGVDKYDLPLSTLVFEFNKNFEKYDKNRVFEFALNKTNSRSIDSSLITREFIYGFPDSRGVDHKILSGNKIKSYLLNPYDPSKLMDAGETKIYVSKGQVDRDDRSRSNKISAGANVYKIDNKPFYFDSAHAIISKDLYIFDGDTSVTEPVLKAGDTFATTLSENSLFTTTGKYSVGDVVSVDYSNMSGGNRVAVGNRFIDSDKYVLTETSRRFESLANARFELVEKTDRSYKWKLLDDISLTGHSLNLGIKELYPIALRSDWAERFGADNLKRYMMSDTRSASTFAPKGSLTSNITFNIKGVETNDSSEAIINKNINLAVGASTTGTIKVVHKTDTGVILKAESTIVADQPWYTPVSIDPKSFEDYQFKSSTELLSTIVGKGERTIELIYTKPKEIVTKEPIKVKYVVDEAKDGGYRNEVAGTATVMTARTDYIYSPETRTANPKTTVTVQEGTPTVVTLGTKPTTEVTYQDFNTRYVADPNRTAGEKFTETEGARGTTTTITTYSVNAETGDVTSTKGQPQVVAPTDKVVKVGAKSTTQTTVIPKGTVYQAYPGIPYESRVTSVAGRDGSVTTTTTYTLNKQNGEVTPSTKVDTVEKEDTVIKIGNVRIESETLPRTTEYYANPDLDFGKKEFQTEGRDGETLVEYTYTVSPTDGSLSNPVRSVVEGHVGFMRPDAYGVGNKKQERRETPITTRYEADSEKVRDEKETVSQGVLGVHTTTTLYTVNSTTGDLSDPVVSETDVPMQPKVIKVGTKPTVETETIAITTRYIFDDNLAYGQQIVEEKGSEGRVVTTTTYTMNEYDGTTTADTPDVQTTPMVQRVIRIGVKPTVEETPINFNTFYEPDPTADKDSRVDKVAGKVGKVTTTTTYTYDSNTGVVTPNPSTSQKEDAVDRIVKVGTRPNVVETPIKFTTTYEADPESQRDSKVDKVVGKNGTTTVTTTYSVDPKTGVVTENPSVTTTKDPVNAVIKVGTKSTEVVETLPSPKRFVKDPTRPKDEEPLTEHGETGSKTTITTYSLNPITGVTSEGARQWIIVGPTDTIVRVPAGDKVVETPIEPTVVYEKDDTRDEGTPNETIPGEKGKIVTTTTYHVNPKDGTVTEKVGEPVVTPAGITKVKVGAKTKVEIIKNGGKTIQRTTSYDVDPNTGKVTPRVNDQVIGDNGDVTPPVVEIPEYTDPIGGNGLDGEGNTIPTPIVEIPEYSGGANPNETPTYDKPEFNGGVTPNDAPIREIPEYDGPMNSNDSDGEGNTIPTPIVEIPEFNGGVTPNDAPIHELPEFEGGITPNDAPIHELPEFEGGVNPNDAPVHELPELEVPDEPVSPTDPIAPILPHVADHRRADDTPSAAHQNDVPSVETPMNEQNTGSNDQTYVDKSTAAQLPNTGTSSSSSMLAAGLASAMSAVGLMFAGFRRKKDN